MTIQLQRITREDLPELVSWIENEEQLVQWSGPWNFRFPLDERQLAEFFLKDRTPDGLGRMQYKAVDLDEESIVGQIGFSRIWSKTESAHVGPVIVAPTRRGMGVGFQMVNRILETGFEELGFHRIELVVFTFNKRAIGCYERAGFQIEGTLREVARINDEYWHWHIMSILGHEWRNQAARAR